MVNSQYTQLVHRLSKVLFPYLDQLLSNQTLRTFQPGLRQAQDVWALLAPIAREDSQLIARLSEISLISSEEEGRVLLAEELERLLTRLSPSEVQSLATLLEEGEATPKSPASNTEEVTRRQFEIKRPAQPDSDGATLRGAQPGAPGGPPGTTFAESTAASITAAAEATAPITARGTTPPRYLRAEITEGNHDQPLPPNQEFTLAFFVDLEAGEEHEATLPFEERFAFAPDEEVARLQVLVSSQDFIVHTRAPQELRIPRSGRSRNKARFDLEPRRDWNGTGEATALFFKDNNFIQGMILQLNVGVGEGVFAAKPESLGRPLDGVSVLQPRDLLLFIKKAVNGFDLTMVGAVQAQAFLPLSPESLNQKIAYARKALLEVVYLAQGPQGIFVQPTNEPPERGVKLPYQAGLDIPPEVGRQGLQRLAEAGWLLYDGLFYGEGTRADAHAIGDKLRELAEVERLKLQIVSQEFFLPWGLLYLAESIDPGHIDPELFLGMKHIIEHIPLQNRMQVHDELIPSKPQLAVSLNLDTSIDAAFKLSVIAEQRAFWDQLAADRQVSLELRETSDEFLGALRGAPEKILYFYGHAVSKDLAEEGGSEASSLSFKGRETVTLRDLKLQAPARFQLEGAPLVFINACESAELSPLFYSGFMPYFIERGARGMIGTECQVPALFAAEWAGRFFKRFLFEERPIGELFLELRREFYARHNNPLGLLYALYCDGDTRVSPGLGYR